MNVPLIPAAPSGTPSPGPAGRGADAAGLAPFSDTLSHRREALHGADRAARAAGAPSRRDAAPSGRGDQHPPTPEETLALLAAGAGLPLMATATTPGEGTPGPDKDSGPLVASSVGAATQAVRAWPAGERVDTHATITDPMAAAADAPDETAVRAAARAQPTGPAGATRDARAIIADAATSPVPARRDGAQAPDPAAASSPQATVRGGAPSATVATEGLVGTTPATAASAARILQEPSAHAPGGGLEPTMPFAANPPLAALSGAQAANAGAIAPASPAVATPLGDPAWPMDFSRQILTLVHDGRGGAQTAELRLNPPDLGPVRIVLHLSDSVAQALFVSPHAPVRHALENALPQLQQQLAQAGLSLGQADVSDQQPGQQAFAQADAQGRGEPGAMTFTLGGASPLPATPAPPEAATQRRAGRVPDALVDTFA
ncbi:flagellar hook-length control protein FliK [Castellaniella sp. GW247-6E4]|uniref:flagellar hook-length control protein FliK n=1 Tax=Castellaniella sp. GW247-6E4 TaxID=3140380 RepID=UPI0033154E76